MVFYVVFMAGLVIFVLLGFYSFIKANDHNRRSISAMVNDMLQEDSRRHGGSEEPSTPVVSAVENLQNCSADLDEGKTKIVLNRIQVVPLSAESPSVLCYVMCTSAFHERVKIIKETWGSHCDGFFIASNVTDEALGAVAIPTRFPHSWEYLWDKQRETIRYLYQHNIYQKYDFVFKADTDSYVIIENLKHHLSKMTKSKYPLMVGRLGFVTAEQRNTWEMPPQYPDYFTHQNMLSRWRYPMGGGYAMNQIFIEKMATSLETDGCLPNRPDLAEDLMTAFCVSSAHRMDPRFSNTLYHHHPPAHFHEMDKKAVATHSVLFHNIKNDDQMFYFIHNQLYPCRVAMQTFVVPDESIPVKREQKFTVRVHTTNAK
jgi:hypothetical protein